MEMHGTPRVKVEGGPTGILQGVMRESGCGRRFNLHLLTDTNAVETVCVTAF